MGGAATYPTSDHLALWNELGIVYKYLGKFKSAQKFYGIALQHSSSCLTGRDRYDFLANLYHNLGGLEHSRGQFGRGERYARESLQFRARADGASSIAVAADKVALAAILDGLCKFNESQKLYRKALKTYRRVYGKSHREIALILNNLASVYQEAGQPSRAETHYRAALAMKRQKLGKAHPDVAITMNNLGMLYASLGREPEARLWFEKALKLLGNSLGKSHPNTRAVKRNLQKMKTTSSMRAVKIPRKA
jgi:tetratricopeptide (TPR) repeat protein